MSWVGILLIALLVALLAYGAWDLYQSRGKIIASASLAPDELVDDVLNYFIPDGWKLEHRGRDFLIMEKGASAWTGLLLLIVFLPLGLVYLLTDWGRAKLGLAFRQGERGAVEFQLTWRNAALRGRVRQFVSSLEEATPAYDRA